MNPISFMLVMVVTCGLLAAPIATHWDPDGAFFANLRRLQHPEYIWVAWVCTAYAFAVMAVLYRFLRLGKAMTWQAHRPPLQLSRRAYIGLWCATFLLAGLCLGIVLYQAGGRHPLLEVDPAAEAVDVALRRQEIAQAINRNILNVGLVIAMPLNLLLATWFLRNRLFIVASIILYVALGTFPLEKAPLAVSLLNLFFFRMLWRPFTLRQSWQMAVYGLGVLGVVVSMYWATRYVNTPQEAGQRVYDRVIYGTISDLPYYFEVFADERIKPTTVLPPYVRYFVDGMQDPPACRRVIEYSQPWAVAAGYAGVANSFFVGEAFALGGYPLVLLSPFLVMANIWVVVRFFRGLPKTPLTTYGQSLLLFLLFADLFLGIGSYIFSAIHVLLIGYFALRLLSRLRPSRRRARSRHYGERPVTDGGEGRPSEPVTPETQPA
jgi:hypothetical protein